MPKAIVSLIASCLESRDGRIRPDKLHLADHATLFVKFVHAFGKQTVGGRCPILANGKLCIRTDVVIIAFVENQTLAVCTSAVFIEIQDTAFTVDAFLDRRSFGFGRLLGRLSRLFGRLGRCGCRRLGRLFGFRGRRSLGCRLRRSYTYPAATDRWWW